MEAAPDTKVQKEPGIVFQDFRLLKDRNVYERGVRTADYPGTHKQNKRNVPAILATVGLRGNIKAKPKQLWRGAAESDPGQGLINRPPILLPTNYLPENLDPKELLGNHEASGEKSTEGEPQYW